MKSIHLRPLDMKWIQSLRKYEIGRIDRLFPLESNILEIGAGAGWQAEHLSGRGFSIRAVDLKDSIYQKEAVFPIIPYDGKNIPFGNDTFDVVFSSCVLEHIDDLGPLLEETRRVLKPDGFAVHLMPTSTWCLISFLTHYLYLGRLGLSWAGRALRIKKHPDDESTIALRIKTHNPSWRFIARSIAAPRRHGERGHFLSEFLVFRDKSWRNRFESFGWTVSCSFSLDILHSGYGVFRHHLSPDQRRWLARWLGGSTRCYVVRPREALRRDAATAES